MPNVLCHISLGSTCTWRIVSAGAIFRAKQGEINQHGDAWHTWHAAKWRSPLTGCIRRKEMVPATLDSPN